MATASRKNAILASARREFSDNGYSGARIERIAAAASANKQLIFHYFGSKDGLYSAVVESIFTPAHSPLDPAASPSDSLRRLVVDLASWFASTPGAALAASECAPGRPVPAEAAKIVAAWSERVSAGIRGAIDDGQRKGYFRDDVDQQHIVELVVGAAVGGALLRPRDSMDGTASARLPPILAQFAVDFCAWR